MAILARCDDCRRDFEVDDDRAGGFAPCPGCGRATPVQGLRDPLYRLLQIGALTVLVVVVAGVAEFVGWPAAVAVLIGGPLVWLGFQRML